MRALIQRQFGALSEVAEVSSDFPRPQVTGKKDVVIKVLCAASNPIDYKLALNDGVYWYVNKLEGMRPPRSFGMDHCGIVTEVGEGVTRFSVGDRVIGMGGKPQIASFAEYAHTLEEALVKAPENLSDEEAAGLTLAGLTSYQALVHKCKIKEGQTLVVLGGSSATGMQAIQIAKALGVHVITTSSQEDMVKSLGADEVINYRTQDWGEVLKGREVDNIFDCVGGKIEWDRANKQGVMKKGGLFCTLIADSPDAVHNPETGREETPSHNAILGLLRFLGRPIAGALGLGHRYNFFLTERANTADIEAVAQLAREGKLKVVLDPDSPYSFTEMDGRRLFAKQMSHRAKGKLVMRIAQRD